ncbi:hypothetical protein QAD02_002122 [Eretmocerus hayati]|uniref:Uncharacterized protein n=1 Tax=Eretmocerus hayati TaxID=131215 RepID=A0ACC2NJ78_9HYME|nr:hypothetical protein QAD02_002122 [Eretmocerus hayati]
MEAAVGAIIHLHVALFGELQEGTETKMIPFNDCQDLPFKIDIPHGNFEETDIENVEPVSIACATLAKCTGTREREARVSDSNIIEVEEQGSTFNEEISVFKVLCRALGESYVTFSVYNIPVLPSCKGGEAVARVKVTCGKPRYIYLQPEFRDGKNCPVSHDTDRVVAHSEETLKLLVIVKDENGRRFDNITSLSIEWNLKPSSAAALEVQLGSLEDTASEYQVILPKNHYQQMLPKKLIDSLNLKAKVAGYQKNVLQKLRITPGYLPFPIENEKGATATPTIEASINILLVNDTIIYPSRVDYCIVD